MKYLCIDYGRRRIGVAVSDPSAVIATARPTIDRNITGDCFSDLVLLINTENPDELVVGLPLDVDDNESGFCKEIKTFCKKLKAVLPKDIPINFQDESFSSHKSNLILQRTSAKKRRVQKGNVDRIAACVILQDFLDDRSNSVHRFVWEN